MNKNYDKKIAKDVLRLRFSQMIVNEDYKKGKFKIPIHLAFGHEAIAVAVNKIMKEDDKLILTQRILSEI
jgi:TPP-dependent pyruvate/acetoin dehydrogenase alpha subunit